MHLLRPALVSLAFLVPMLGCGDGDPLEVAAYCECDNRWSFADGSWETERYSEPFYCYETAEVIADWVFEEVRVCEVDSFPEAESRACECSCAPTGRC